MNEHERVTEENLYAKYRHAFDFAKKVIESSSTIPVVIPMKAGDENLQKAILAAHYSRALHLNNGVYKLCLCGNANEAKILLRSLLNLEINLRWLVHQNDEERRTRMERFAEFEAVYKKRAIDTLFKYNRTPAEFSKDDSFYKELEEKVQTIRMKYSLTDERQMDKWSRRSIYGMATDVGRQEQYEIQYSNLSELEHTGPASVPRYLDDSEKGVVCIKTGPLDEGIDVTLASSLHYFLSVKRIVFSVFDLNVDNIDTEENEWLRIFSIKS